MIRRVLAPPAAFNGVADGSLYGRQGVRRVAGVIVRIMARLWDDSLYAGSAEFYVKGRLPYPERLADVFRDNLDGTGRLLDLGCGPGSLSLVLASSFDEVLAVDADAEMIRVGQAAAASSGIRNVTWLHEDAEDVHGVGQFRVVTLAQSFHWMDRAAVADKIRGWLHPHGYCVHLGATTHEGTGATEGLPYPAPPRDRIRELVQAYLGPDRRAGQGVAAGGYTPDDEEAVFRAAGFVGPQIAVVPGGDIFQRSEDQVIASVLSLSSAAPHLFDDRLAAFLGDLRQLLRETSPSGSFTEQLQDMRLFVWRISGPASLAP